MGKDFLSKVKGYSSTFVVHSNTSQYAAVAAMAAMLGRGRELVCTFSSQRS